MQAGRHVSGSQSGLHHTRLLRQLLRRRWRPDKPDHPTRDKGGSQPDGSPDRPPRDLDRHERELIHEVREPDPVQKEQEPDLDGAEHDPDEANLPREGNCRTAKDHTRRNMARAAATNRAGFKAEPERHADVGHDDDDANDGGPDGLTKGAGPFAAPRT